MIYIALPVSSIHACSFFLISWNNKQFACSVFHLKYTNFIIIMFAPSCITLLDDYRGFFPGRARGQVGKFLREVSMNFRGSFNNIWRRPLLYGLSRALTILGPSPSLKLFLNVFTLYRPNFRWTNHVFSAFNNEKVHIFREIR